MELAPFKNSDIRFFFSESDENGKYTFESSKFSQIDGRSKSELSELKVNDIRSSNVPQYIFDEIYDWTRNKGYWRGVLENVNKNNETYWVHATVTRIHHNGEIRYGMVSTSATSEQIQKAKNDYRELSHHQYRPEIGRRGLLYVLSEDYNDNRK